MQLAINFVGTQPNEQTPNIALYSIDARGAAHKIVAESEGKLDLGKGAGERVKGTIAIGPDVPDPSTLDGSLLQKFSAAQTLPEWEESAAIQVAAQWWRRWLPITVCVSGQVRRCLPIIIDRKPFLRNLALARIPFPPHRSCVPICNGVVEIWESTCCDYRFAPNAQLHEDLQTIEASSPQDAVQYFTAHRGIGAHQI
jgi:hypothetical protein